jgi:integral membrane protein
MIKLFRYIGIFEGLTTLALFFVAMPAKYWFGFPDLVPPVGMIHGGAFVLYILAMVVCLSGRGFSAWEWARTTIAAFFPFGTFLNDGMLKRKELAAAAV